MGKLSPKSHPAAINGNWIADFFFKSQERAVLDLRTDSSQHSLFPSANTNKGLEKIKLLKVAMVPLKKSQQQQRAAPNCSLSPPGVYDLAASSHFTDGGSEAQIKEP